MTQDWQIRLFAAFAIFAAVALWEALAPHRRLEFGRLRRWPSNIGLIAVDALVLRALFPVALAGVALFAQQRGWGLFNLVAAPSWLAGLVSILVLDFVIFAQHVAFHRIPTLWRLHRMHHADLDYDLTTALRFHPFELAISFVLKSGTVVALGAPPWAALAFEILLNGLAMFNHANAALPRAVEPFVRAILVTPDMHRVHHSVEPAETHSNFGFNLSIWDRLFRVYRAEPTGGQAGMTVGLPILRDEEELRLDRMLTQPFREG
ncbi:MAG: sterol desaturase family protein [Rhodoblastus sp.]